MTEPAVPPALAALAALACAGARGAGAADDGALAAAADAVTARATALIDELGALTGAAAFVRDRTWFAVEVLHSARAAGSITDVDEIVRIWAVAEAFAAAVRAQVARDGRADLHRLTAMHRAMTFEALGAPARAPIPGGPAIDDAILARGSIRPVDRIAEGAAAWTDAIERGGADGADERLAMDRGEHGRSLRLIAWAREEGLISETERARVAEALGERRGPGGWTEGTPTAIKGAAQELLGLLHAMWSERFPA